MHCVALDGAMTPRGAPTQVLTVLLSFASGSFLMRVAEGHHEAPAAA